MIKAVFFDLYHTLVRYDPPPEELEALVPDRESIIMGGPNLALILSPTLW